MKADRIWSGLSGSLLDGVAVIPEESLLDVEPYQAKVVVPYMDPGYTGTL